MFKVIPLDDDKKVINPDTFKRVPKDGVVIPKVTTYWKNREKDKDVTIEDLSKKSKKVTSKKEEIK